MSDKDQNPLHSPNNHPSSEQNNDTKPTNTIKQISPEQSQGHQPKNDNKGPKLDSNNFVKVPVYKRQLHKAIVRRIPYFMSEQQFHNGLTNNMDVEIVHK